MNYLLGKSLAVSALIWAAASSNASIVLQERQSTLNVFYNYGSTFETYPGSNSVNSSSFAEDHISINGLDMNSGFTDVGFWSGGVQYDLNQQFIIQSDGFFGAGDTQLNSFVSGDMFANIDSNDPGNEQIIRFQNTLGTIYNFAGAATYSSTVRLERHVGSDWENVYTSPVNDGFSVSGFLGIGEYRIIGKGVASASGQVSQGAAWSYNFTTVPEPSSMAALAVGGLALFRRRRRRS